MCSISKIDNQKQSITIIKFYLKWIKIVKGVRCEQSMIIDFSIVPIAFYQTHRFCWRKSFPRALGQGNIRNKLTFLETITTFVKNSRTVLLHRTGNNIFKTKMPVKV